jgi:lysophospholipase L1-like esterase
MPRPYSILVLGDSVAWGQGLPASQKMHAIVERRFSEARGQVQSRLVAHSGAIIGVGVTSGRDAVHGEVPKPYPTILQQAEQASEEIDLVVVNGGINDVDIRVILNPFTDRAALVATTQRHCHRDFGRLLDAIARRFPAAIIVALAYYPILSADSRPPRIPRFTLEAGGVPIGPAVRLFGPGTVLGKIVDNCRIFYEESTAALGRAIDEFNSVRPAGPAAHLAVPPFGPRNAALAPEAWLFGIKVNGMPEDAVSRERRANCNRFERDPLQRLQCHRASAGHPNPEGARRYATAILERLGIA